MANVAVIGAQWGDEGKGKVVDWLASRAEIVVRFQGGHNAGHTLVVGNQTYKLSLLPSGAGARQARHHRQRRGDRPGGAAGRDRPRARAGAGRLAGHAAHRRERDADPAGARRARPRARGGAGRAQDRHHRAAASARPTRTRSPAARSASATWPSRRRWPTSSTSCCCTTTRCCRAWAPRPFEKQALLDRLLALAPRILPYVEPVWERLDEARRAGTRILFEGAQAVMLDVDHGTYPFVTSSNTVAATAAAGVGRRARPRSASCSASPRPTRTRVGSGPFPTELHRRDRPAARRRAGTSSAPSPAARAAAAGSTRRWCARRCKVGGIQGLALTKLDVLDGLPELQIGVGYEIDGAPLPSPAGRAGGAGRGEAGLRDDRGLVRLDPRRPLLGGAAGAGDQIRPPDRGAGRDAGDAALHQPRARRHDPDARPVRGLTR